MTVVSFGVVTEAKAQFKDRLQTNTSTNNSFARFFTRNTSVHVRFTGSNFYHHYVIRRKICPCVIWDRTMLRETRKAVKGFFTAFRNEANACQA